MELIAVMAIMAILAGSLAPTIFDQIKRAKAEAESKNLIVIMDNLKTYIQEQKIIPTSSTSNWTQAISSVSNSPINKLEYNSNNFRRRLVFDPQFLSNVDSNFSGVIQNQGLALEPVSPRIMLISNLNANASSLTNSSSIFNDIWQQNSSALIKESVDVKIERLNLKNIFNRVVLTNSNPNLASFQLENGSIVSIPAASVGSDGIISRWVISKTKISLYGVPATGIGMGDLEQTNIIESDWTSRYQSNGTTWFWGKP